MEFNDGVPLTLGVRFASDSPGQITGIRYYRATGDAGTHTGALYTAGGQQLASVTFDGESSAGWQTATSPTRGHCSQHRVRGCIPHSDRDLFGDIGRV